MWYPFDNGQSIGQHGSENGAILRDEEHEDGARITLERGGYTPFAITCGIYGWMVHTRFFSTEEVAQSAYDEMKSASEGILEIIPYQNDNELEAKIKVVTDAISDFIERFP